MDLRYLVKVWFDEVDGYRRGDGALLLVVLGDGPELGEGFVMGTSRVYSILAIKKECELDSVHLILFLKPGVTL